MPIRSPAARCKSRDFATLPLAAKLLSPVTAGTLRSTEHRTASGPVPLHQISSGSLGGLGSSVSALVPRATILTAPLGKRPPSAVTIPRGVGSALAAGVPTLGVVNLAHLAPQPGLSIVGSLEGWTAARLGGLIAP